MVDLHGSIYYILILVLEDKEIEPTKWHAPYLPISTYRIHHKWYCWQTAWASAPSPTAGQWQMITHSSLIYILINQIWTSIQRVWSAYDMIWSPYLVPYGFSYICSQILSYQISHNWMNCWQRQFHSCMLASISESSCIYICNRKGFFFLFININGEITIINVSSV
jgi:hypothetical protein